MCLSVLNMTQYSSHIPSFKNKLQQCAKEPFFWVPNTEHILTWQQARDVLQGQLGEAQQKCADLSVQRKTEPQQLNEAANKAVLAEKQQQELQEQLNVGQQRLQQAKERADKVCLLLTHHQADRCSAY